MEKTNNMTSDILSGLTTAVILLDQNENVYFINIAASELLQLSRSKIIGVSWRYILPRLLEDIKRAETISLTTHDYEISLPNGEKTYLTCTISIFYMETGQGWLIEMSDTKKLHQIAEEDERRHQYEASKLLVKTLAHEVKNPLAGIYGAAQLLRKRIPDNEKSNNFLDVITNEVNRLKNLVDRMLGPSKHATKERCNIHDLLNYVLGVIENEKPYNISIRLDYDPSIPNVLIDFESMVQAILNITQNAMQAMEKHGGLLTIKTRIESKFTLGNQNFPLVLILSIIDQGEGIPKDIFDNIFYPMVSSKKQGTGLGLPVAQDILRNHQGLIVASNEKTGTVFNIYLPIEKEKNE